MRARLLLLLLGLPGCIAEATLVPTFTPGENAEGFLDIDLCGFEQGDLAPFGFPGVSGYETSEEGQVEIVTAGTDFSGLLGEEALPFDGDRAVLLRSAWGDLGTVAQLRTVPFRPGEATFVMDQLSEVGEGFIDLEVMILDAETGDAFEIVDIPIATGGFVPELPDGGDPIEEVPEITATGGRPGQFIRSTIDLTDYWLGRVEIQIQFRQQTLVQHNGFFTLLDNLCLQSVVE